MSFASTVFCWTLVASSRGISLGRWWSKQQLHGLDYTPKHSQGQIAKLKSGKLCSKPPFIGKMGLIIKDTIPRVPSFSLSSMFFGIKMLIFQGGLGFLNMWAVKSSIMQMVYELLRMDRPSTWKIWKYLHSAELKEGLPCLFNAYIYIRVYIYICGKIYIFQCCLTYLIGIASIIFADLVCSFWNTWKFRSLTLSHLPEAEPMFVEGPLFDVTGCWWAFDGARVYPWV